MDGAEAALATAHAAGVDLCLANPGTTEMPLVAALDRTPGIRTVLGLFEGVCTGAADGYGRMTRRPALTLLHLGPGFANGIANLHNARRAGSPVVNLVGEHATWHRAADAPLSSDIAALAGAVSRFVDTPETAAALPAAMAAAIAAATGPAAGVATLIIPADCQWDSAPGPLRPAARVPGSAPTEASISAAAAALQQDAAVLLLGGRALDRRGLLAAARITAGTGCRVVTETFWSRLERGGDLLAFERLPYFPEQARAALAGSQHFVLAGAPEPVAFFGYPGDQSRLAPTDAELLPLAHPEQDIELALEALAERVGKPAPARELPTRPVPATGALDPGSLGTTLAALMPEDAIVMDEGATSSLPCFVHAAAAPAHSWLTLTGGAIGQGLPCATGAALACPERRVIALQADGSGMYTLQALWTQAREGLDVTTVICANRSYRILQIELHRAGIAEPGPRARALTDLSHPSLDWVALARGHGVPATRAETAESFARALEASFATPGPHLIEAVLP